MDKILLPETITPIESFSASLSQLDLPSPEATGPQTKQPSPMANLDKSDGGMKGLMTEIGAVHAIKWSAPGGNSTDQVFSTLAWFGLRNIEGKLSHIPTPKKRQSHCIIA